MPRSGRCFFTHWLRDVKCVRSRRRQEAIKGTPLTLMRSSGQRDHSLSLLQQQRPIVSQSTAGSDANHGSTVSHAPGPPPLLLWERPSETLCFAQGSVQSRSNYVSVRSCEPPEPVGLGRFVHKRKRQQSHREKPRVARLSLPSPHNVQLVFPPSTRPPQRERERERQRQRSTSS